ncbi:MAG: membrane protein [marine bacterium B5-7]|nr:MAG: membrane protein [marine bacterium B5-7]
MRFFLFFTLLIIISFNTVAETDLNGNSIALSESQRKSYGITTKSLLPATEVLGSRYPAEVVVPNSQLHVIGALQGGLVEALMVAEGEHVKQGQILARIQSPGLLELQRDLLQTLTQLNLARSTLNRDEQLLNEGIIPKRRFLESQSAWQELVTQKEQQEASLKFSGMDSVAITALEKTRKLNSSMTVTAPFDGVLLEQMAIPGQKLEPADPVFQLGKLSPLWLEIHVPVSVVNGVVLGDTIAVPELDIAGEIITIGRKVHAADQGTLIRAIVRDNIEQLRPGQFIQARLVLNSDEQIRYLIPRKGVVRINNNAMVFFEYEQGYTAMNVHIVGSYEEQLIITLPRVITAPVVTSGAVSLKAILIGAGGEG